jgi:aspartate racemase
MEKHIGIVACSSEGASLCYRTICAESADLMGEHTHPEISMHTFPLSRYMVHVRAGDWNQVAALMLASTEKLAAIGAEFAICPDNTIHQAYDLVTARSPIPWLHIVDSVAACAKQQGFEKLGITGTKYLMTGPVYPDILTGHGLAFEIPDPEDRERIDEIIFGQLVKGLFPEDARRYFNEVFSTLKARGCDAAVMGCTEIPLLVDPNDTPLPVLDSTQLLARAALKHSLGLS